MDTTMISAVETVAQITVPLKIVIVGHVDHGKSTLVGRLFHDTGSLPEGRVEAVRAMSEKRGMPFEWAFLLDSLQAERDQGITIDISQIFFRTALRNYVLIDAPGHREFVKNMVTGAAQADAAVLVVDGRDGMQEQTRRHAYLLHLLGIQQIIVAINKMDMVEYSEARFQEVAAAVRDYLADLGIDLQHTLMIPVVARDGENIVVPPKHMPWFTGMTLAAALDELQPPVTSLELPLRFPVQDVYKFDDRRIIAGRIESGTLSKGDTLLFSPSNKTAKVASIENWNTKDEVMQVRAGEFVGITLDEQIFVERGEIISHATNAPMLTNVFRGRIFWLGKTSLVARRPLQDEAVHRRISGRGREDRKGHRHPGPGKQRTEPRRTQCHRRGGAALAPRLGARSVRAQHVHRPFRPGRRLRPGRWRADQHGRLCRPAQPGHQVDQHLPRRAPGADRGAVEGQRPSRAASCG